jgi:hypothetical protein
MEDIGAGAPRSRPQRDEGKREKLIAAKHGSGGFLNS